MNATVRVVLSGFCLGAVALAPDAAAFTITVNQDVGAGPSLSGSGGETVTCAGGTGTTGDPFRYEWSGSSSADLVLGGQKIFTSNGKSFKLDLLKDAVKGSVSGTANNATLALSTRQSSAGSGGNISLVQVGAVTIGKIDASLNGSPSGGSTGGHVVIGESGTPAGAVQVAGIATWAQNYNGPAPAGNVTIYAAGAVSIKDADGTRRDIDTSAAGRGNGGAIGITHQGNLYAGNVKSFFSGVQSYGAGAVQLTGDGTGSLDLSGIQSYSEVGVKDYRVNSGGDVTIRKYTAVTVGGAIDAQGGKGTVTYGLNTGYRAGNVAIGESGDRVGAVTIGGILTQARNDGVATGGVVTIYSSGDVRIKDSGDALQSIRTGGLIKGRIASGPITVVHPGDFQAHQIDSSTMVFNDAAGCGGGAVLCDGENGGGSFEVNGFKTCATNTSAGTSAYAAGNVTIRNYGSVKINGDINSAATGTSTGTGANVNITNIADTAEITGTVDLRGTSAANYGTLRLEATNRITLGSLDMAKVKQAVFSSTTFTNSFITGVLTNFDRANNQTTGALDAAAGQTIRYDGTLPGNAYLKQAPYTGVYTLKSGGILTDEIYAAPVITSSLTAAGSVGIPFTYAIAASGTAPITYGAASLPGGLSFDGDHSISGTPTADGVFNVTLGATNYIGSTNVTLVLTIAPASSPPTVASQAAANPNPVTTGTTTALTVLGADDGGPENLAYTWSVTGAPPASVLFVPNGTTAASNTTATFTKPGFYGFRVLIVDGSFLSVTSWVDVAVSTTLTTIVVSPASVNVPVNLPWQFNAVAKDQFNDALATQPAFSWTVSGGGTIGGASGLFTAGGSVGGPYEVKASSGGVDGTASVTVIADTTPFTINGDQDVGAGASLTGTDDAPIAPTGDGSTNTPYLYAWTFSQAANLELGVAGNNKISTSNGKSFTLDLLRSGIKGSVTGTVNNATLALSTEKPGTTAASAGNVALVNVGDVRIGRISTRFTSDPTTAIDAGRVQIGASGNPAGTVQVAGIVTTGGGWAHDGPSHSGNVTIFANGPVRFQDAGGTRRNVDTSMKGRGNGGDIVIQHTGGLVGGTVTSACYTAGGNTGRGGHVQLTGDGTGTLDLDTIVTETTPNPGGLAVRSGGDVTIKGYSAITIAGALDTDCGTNAVVATDKAGDVTIGELANRVGPVRLGGVSSRLFLTQHGAPCTSGVVRIYSSGDVLIKDSGDVLKNVSVAALPTSRASSLGITIDHTGDFEADQLDASLYDVYLTTSDRRAGPILCDGNNSGSFRANSLLAYTVGNAAGGTAWPHRAGNVTVRNYTSVTVSNVNLSATGAGNGYAGSAAITNISGAIAISGVINLGAVGTGEKGTLTLSCGGQVALAALDMAAVKSAVLHSGSGISRITGALANFDRGGNEASGALDAAAGQIVHYDSGLPGNAYLKEDGYSGTYTLKSGGLLSPSVSAGTLILVF